MLKSLFRLILILLLAGPMVIGARAMAELKNYEVVAHILQIEEAHPGHIDDHFAQHRDGVAHFHLHADVAHPSGDAGKYSSSESQVPASKQDNQDSHHESDTHQIAFSVGLDQATPQPVSTRLQVSFCQARRLFSNERVLIHSSPSSLLRPPIA